jgi:hypothetical protein
MPNADLIACLLAIEGTASAYRTHPTFRDRPDLLRRALVDARKVLEKPDGREPGISEARGRILTKCNEIIHVLGACAIRVESDWPGRARAVGLCGELIGLVKELMPYLEARMPQRRGAA